MIPTPILDTAKMREMATKARTFACQLDAPTIWSALDNLAKCIEDAATELEEVRRDAERTKARLKVTQELVERIHGFCGPIIDRRVVPRLEQFIKEHNDKIAAINAQLGEENG